MVRVMELILSPSGHGRVWLSGCGRHRGGFEFRMQSDGADGAGMVEVADVKPKGGAEGSEGIGSDGAKSWRRQNKNGSVGGGDTVCRLVLWLM